MKTTSILAWASAALCACGLAATTQAGQQPPRAPTFEGEKTAWQGAFDRYDFIMDEQTLAIQPFKVEKDDKVVGKGQIRCIVVLPKRVAAGRPWSWRDLYFDPQGQTETELLERGFHVAYITPGPAKQKDAWLAFMTEKHGLAKKPVTVGMAKAPQLQAGTAKIDITPDQNRQPVHDHCLARTLVLDVNGERVGFVSVDLGIYTSDRLEAAAKEKYGISHLVLSSSHTHSDPGAPANFYEAQIMKALDEAVKNMFPARISAGHRTFPQLGFNRLVVREDGHSRESWFSDDHYTSENPERIPFGPVDPQVGVIKIEDTKGQPRAILMNYACHADVVCQNYAVSADYPGAACKHVEEAFDNKLNCLFVQGGAGNIESLIISSRRTGPTDPFPTDYSTIERVGQLLAYEADKLTKTLSPKGDDANIRFMNDSLKFSGRFDKNSNFDIHISTIVINDDIVIATFPGEPFVQLQLEWKKKMEGTHPFLFGYTWYQGTWPNYVPDIASAATGGYGADQAGPNMIEVGSGEAIMNKHLENYLRLTGLMREEPGPVGFKPGNRWQITPVPRDIRTQ
jgi:neutral ceramidase